MSGSIFFIVMSVLCLAGALWTVLARNPIRSAVGLLVTILGMAGLFLKLNAQFLAAIQIIVYAGAVVILFVFVIMLLGPDARLDLGRGKARLTRGLAGLLTAVMGLVALGYIARAAGEPTHFRTALPNHGNVEAVGERMFTVGIVPFELATALLIVAVVGAIAVARGASRRRKVASTETNATKRVFAGPVHPRDAGRPLAKENAS